MQIIVFTRRNHRKPNRLTINGYPFFMIFFFDPIEQYDFSLITLKGHTVYVFYLHILLVILALLWLVSRLQLTVFGYFQHKLYIFIKEAFLAVCGSEKQILFSYFYYIFLFLLIGNGLGMIP